MMDITQRGDKYPLLGEPKLMFEGDNVYVVYERAEMGKTYSFVCPHCHTVFTAMSDTDEVKKVKCPECETYVCFSAKRSERPAIQRRTLVSMTGNAKHVLPGVLVWNDGTTEHRHNLTPGSFIIGRADAAEPSDISVDDATASRRSVKLDVTKGEQTGRFLFRLTVLRTTNAVRVNQNELYTKSNIYLNYGDTIKIGKTIFTLKELE